MTSCGCMDQQRLSRDETNAETGLPDGPPACSGSLRQLDGLSGFPKPYEADDDAFIAGHASNSVSVALGMARARTIKGENYSVCAVIGDGALTGGLAYEGLANVGGSSEPIVIILNDNGMSINGNVGGIAKLLSGVFISLAQRMTVSSWSTSCPSTGPR